MRLCFIFCLFFFSLQAKIIECPRFEQLIEHADEETLVLLDIDDTLLTPAQMLGSDEWFMHRYRLHQQNGMDKTEALDKSLAEWEGVRHLTKMELIERETPSWIEHLQKKKIPIMGLTTQGMVLNTRTAQQLRHHQIDLARTAPSKTDHYFVLDNGGVLFRNGILSTSGRHKGKALFQFCDTAGLKPKKILFINDKATHLAEIEASAHERGIEFIGLRYAGSDPKKQAFCPNIADYQFTHSPLHRLLSDEEAKKECEKTGYPIKQLKQN